MWSYERNAIEWNQIKWIELNERKKELKTHNQTNFQEAIFQHLVIEFGFLAFFLVIFFNSIGLCSAHTYFLHLSTARTHTIYVRSTTNYHQNAKDDADFSRKPLLSSLFFSFRFISLRFFAHFIFSFLAAWLSIFLFHFGFSHRFLPTFFVIIIPVFELMWPKTVNRFQCRSFVRFGSSFVCVYAYGIWVWLAVWYTGHWLFKSNLIWVKIFVRWKLKQVAHRTLYIEFYLIRELCREEMTAFSWKSTTKNFF